MTHSSIPRTAPAPLYVLYVLPDDSDGLEDWVGIVTQGETVLATRRGRVPQIKAWVEATFPLVHDRAAHMAKQTCATCARERAWARSA